MTILDFIIQCTKFTIGIRLMLHVFGLRMGGFGLRTNEHSR